MLHSTNPLADVSIDVLTLVFRAFLTEQGMEHLASALKKGGIKDLLLFFPANKRDAKSLEEHFRAAGLPQVSDWYIKKQSAAFKDSLTADLREMSEREESAEAVSLESLEL